MALKDPVAVYNAASNDEALHLRDLLADAGIEAFAVEDVSMVGASAVGWVPELHKPQVWVDRSSVERAVPILEAYERRDPEHDPEGPDELYCYECGEAVPPEAVTCPVCRKTLDWSAECGEDGDGGSRMLVQSAGANAVSQETPSAKHSGKLDTLRAFKKPLAWIYLSPFLFMVAMVALAVVGAILGILFR